MVTDRVCESGYCCVWERGNCTWVCYMGSSEMSQIWVLWWHFWRLFFTVDFDDGFNTKVCSLDHIIIVVYINDVAIRGIPKCPKFTCCGHTFGGCWLLLILIMFHYKSMFSWSYNHCCMYQWCGLYGVFRNVANSRAVVTLFGGDWLLLILMMFSTQKYVQLII